MTSSRSRHPLSPPSTYPATSPAMVSQPLSANHSLPGERALTVRRPASVSGRSTTSRRHRSHRSHHGGSSSYQPQNEFPTYTQTGDVEINVAIDGQEKRYILHRLILSQCSGFFEASTSEAWSRHQTQQQHQQLPLSPNGSNVESRLGTIGEDSDASSSSRTRIRSLAPPANPQRPMWRYELDTSGAEADDEIPMLVQKPFTASSMTNLISPLPPPVRDKPQAPSNGFFRSMVGMQSAVHLPNYSSLTTQPKQPESEIIRDYDNLFRIFYNYAPNLDSVDITEAYIQCKTLLTLADMYDALDVVGPRIEHHLLQYSNRLWKQIAKYPASYLKLAFLAKSKAIFNEALIHVVGQWPLAAQQLRSVPDSVLDLIDDKVADLEDLKARIEGRLFRLTFTTARGERITPMNSYSDWLVVSLFRHWLAENLTASTPPPLPKSLPTPTTTIATTTSHQQQQHPNLRHHSALPPPPNSAHGHGPPSHYHHNQPPPYSTTATTTTINPGVHPLGTPPSGTTLSSGRVFRLLGAGGPAYLSHDEIKRFIKGKGEGEYTRDSVRKFDRKMDELKTMAREVVRPLMRNFLELEGVGGNTGGNSGGGSTGSAAGGGGLGYLTCTKVEEGDFPW